VRSISFGFRRRSVAVAIDALAVAKRPNNGADSEHCELTVNHHQQLLTIHNCSVNHQPPTALSALTFHIPNSDVQSIKGTGRCGSKLLPATRVCFHGMRVALLAFCCGACITFPVDVVVLFFVSGLYVCHGSCLDHLFENYRDYCVVDAASSFAFTATAPRSTKYVR